MPNREVTVERIPCSFELNAKRSAFEAGRFTGLASVFDSVVDTMPNRTRFRRGAFTKSIRDRGNRIKILSQHDQGTIWIGLPTRLQETEEGLLLEASLNNTQHGRDAAEALKHAVALGKLDAVELSIGFDALNFEMAEQEDGEILREVTEARLWEVSLVNFGADRQTRVMEAANLKQLLKETPPLDELRQQDEVEIAEAEMQLQSMGGFVYEGGGGSDICQ